MFSVSVYLWVCTILGISTCGVTVHLPTLKLQPYGFGRPGTGFRWKYVYLVASSLDLVLSCYVKVDSGDICALFLRRAIKIQGNCTYTHFDFRLSLLRI